MSVANTTDATFAEDVLESELPVLVEFTAAWCPPCRMIAPVLEQIAGEEAGRLKVVAIDTDMNSATMLRYQVMSLPTLALFKNGTVVSQTVGARPKAAILREIEPHLAAASV
ncbi:MAG: thioredoxin [Actinomycetota bacterium]|nr:thioredoxin [Actinomycetota bacterium]